MSRRSVDAVVFVLLAVAASATLDGQVRSRRTNTYYVAADTVTWDYTPSGSNQITAQPFDSVERPFVVAGKWHIGHLALKAIYREYTDSTFTRLKARPPEWQHLGILGPLLRAAEEADSYSQKTRDTLWEALRLSLLTSCISLAIIVAFGTPLAYLLARRVFPGQHQIGRASCRERVCQYV